MIRVSRTAPPAELTRAKVKELTDAFLLDSRKAPWNAKFIREALLRMSHGKCVYCETRIDEESKYMEVDHYRCKSLYPKLAVEWTEMDPVFGTMG
jgi:uncharacterized protein (TIGR02646 family)